MKKSNRTLIIKAALFLFERHGFKKTTMDDIARKVNKGKSSLYYYFSSKEEVFKAVVEYEKNQLQKRVQIAVDQEEGTKAKLRAYIFERISLVKEYGKLFNTLYSEAYANLSFIDDARSSFSKSELLIVRNILKEGMRIGELRNLDLNMTAAAAVMAFKGVEAPLSYQIDKYDQRALANTMVSVIYNGLARRESLL